MGILRLMRFWSEVTAVVCAGLLVISLYRGHWLNAITHFLNVLTAVFLTKTARSLIASERRRLQPTDGKKDKHVS